MTLRLSIVLLSALALVMVAAPSDAALTTSKCLTGKARAAGSLRKCRIDAEARLLEGKEANLMKCDVTFATKLAKLGEKATKAGIPCRFLDNGDGTVTDYDTGLQWEKKNSPDGVEYFPNPNDVDNLYRWNTTGDAVANGEVFSEFLGRLNGSEANPFGIGACESADGTDVGGGFAGHCDWRLPTIVELTRLVDPTACGVATPCLDPIVGLVDPGIGYVTSTADDGNSAKVWYVLFARGDVENTAKGSKFHARAVRGGW